MKLALSNLGHSGIELLFKQKTGLSGPLFLNFTLEERQGRNNIWHSIMWIILFLKILELFCLFLLHHLKPKFTFVYSNNNHAWFSFLCFSLDEISRSWLRGWKYWDGRSTENFCCAVMKFARYFIHISMTRPSCRKSNPTYNQIICKVNGSSQYYTDGMSSDTVIHKDRCPGYTMC